MNKFKENIKLQDKPYDQNFKTSEINGESLQTQKVEDQFTCCSLT